MNEPIRILYVDDYPLDRELVRDALEKEQGGFRVTEATSRADFEARLAEGDYDLVLSDFNILGFEGLQVLDTVRAKNPRVPVVIVTGTGSEEVAAEAMKRGAADYVIKTVSHIQRLPLTIHAALEKKRLEEERARTEQERDRLFNYSLDLLCIAGFDGYFKQVNPAWEKTLGWTNNELVAKPYLEFVHPDDREPTAHAAAKLAGGKSVIAFENRYCCKDGTYRWISWNSYPLVEESLIFGVARDITERKRAEEALHHSEAQLSNAMKIAMLGYWEYDVAEDMFTFNDHFYAIFRTSAEQVGGYKLSPARYAELFLHPDDRSIVAVEMKKALETTDPHYSRQLEHRIIYADGEIGYISVRYFVVKDDQGRTIKTYGANQDITERKRAEEALRESESKYRTLVENIPQKIFTKDGDSVYVSCNENFARDLGIKPDQLAGRTDYDFFPGELADKYRADDKRVMETGQTEELEEKYPQAGQELWVQTIKTPIRQDDGTITGILGVFWDITEHKQAEEEREQLLAQIQEQAQRVQQIVDTVPEGVILIDTEYRTVLANPVGRRDLNTLASAQVGDVLTHLGECPLAEILTSPPKGLWHEVPLGNRSFQIIARPIEDGPSPKGWVLVVRDVTQQRETERRIQQQERLVAVGQLAAGIAHDFNNVMAVISLYAGMELRTPDLPEETHARLETIKQQAERASALIQQILDFSRRAVLERGPTDMLIFLKEQSELLRRTLPENIKIDLIYGRDEYVARADPTRIQQAIVNLATNARDAMPEGGQLRIGLDRIHVQDHSSTPLPEMEIGDWVRVTVADTGTGIPPEMMEHIFVPFFTTKPPGKGTGLGLAQVYGIIKQHDGYIDVSTTVGEGTTFTLYLPALSMEQATTPPEPLALTRGQGQTILTVEDEASTRKAIVDSLELLGYQVLEAANGQKALTVFEQHEDQIDLVLSDIVMPEMGGKALFMALKQRYPGVKVVLMSGHPLEATEIETLLADGLSNWLPKPPDLEQLAQVMAQALAEDACQSEPSGSKPPESE